MTGKAGASHLARCTVPGISVSFADGGGRSFTVGDIVDLDAHVAPGNKLTWREALKEHANHFVTDATVKTPAQE